MKDSAENIKNEIDIGGRIKEFRRKRGINQKELAEALDISPSVISNLEKGKSMVGVYTLLEIISFLSMGIEQLLPEYTKFDEADVLGFSDLFYAFNKYSPEQKRAIISLMKEFIDIAGHTE